MKKRDIVSYLIVVLFLGFVGYFKITGGSVLLLDSVFPCEDDDGDNFSTTQDCGTLDFNDNDKFIFPGAPEWCDGKDNNNDGRTDYISSPGDLCPDQDCYSNICKFGMIWRVIDSSDYSTLNKFDLVLSNSQNTNDAQSINPKFITHRTFIETANYPGEYYGWSTINSNEDWFFHANSGSRLQNLEYPNLWLMNISNQEYQDFKIQETASISNYPGLDGWFYDNYISYTNYNSMLSRNYEIPASTFFQSSTQYENIMKDTMYWLKRSLGNKLLIGNNHAYTGYSNYFDGYMAENWVHNSADSGWLPYYTESFWLQDIQKVQNSAHRNKVLILVCKNQVWDQSVFDFCFASYLLAKTNEAKTFFGFDFSGNTDITYYPEYDIDLGAPTNNYYLQNDLYQRDFENGKVVLNVRAPAQTRSLSLSKDYKNFNGDTLNGITLDDHEAIILLNLENSEEGSEEEVTEEEVLGTVPTNESQIQIDISESLELNEEDKTIISLIDTNYKETTVQLGEYKLQLLQGINHSLELNEINETRIILNLDGSIYEIPITSNKIINIDGYSLDITYLEYTCTGAAKITLTKEKVTLFTELEIDYSFVYILVGLIISIIIIISILKFNKDKELYG